MPAMALASIFAYGQANAEVVLIADFEDGKTQGWGKGGAATNPMKVETDTDGNKYIRLISAGEGSTDDDKKVVFHNSKGAWRGNYNAKGVKFVTAKFKNMGETELELHLAVGNTLADLRTRQVVIEGAKIPADGQWHEAKFSLASDAMQMVALGGHGKSSASFSVSEVLGNVASIRFSQGQLGSETGQGHSKLGYTGWNGGPETKADLWIDDIALTTD